MNFILTRDKAITIPPAATKLSGIPDDAKLELTTVTSAMKTVVFTVSCQSKNFADLLSPFPIGPVRKRTSRPTPSWTAMWMRTPA